MASGRIRAAAVILNPGGDKILLMHRRKAGQEYWVFPGGGVEDGETEEEGVAREIKEEVGLVVKKIIEKWRFYHSLDEQTHPAFLVQVDEDPPFLTGPEMSQNSPLDWYNPEWVSLKQALKLNNLYPDPVRDWLRKRYEN